MMLPASSAPAAAAFLASCAAMPGVAAHVCVAVLASMGSVPLADFLLLPRRIQSY